MPATSFVEAVRRIAQQPLQASSTAFELWIDLSGSECHEGFILHCARSSVPSIEHFAALAVQKVLQHLAVEADEIADHLRDLSARPYDTPLLDTTTWLQATPGANLAKPEGWSSLVSGLRGAICCYYLFDVGPPPVQECVIAEAANDWVAVYWYTTG